MICTRILEFYSEQYDSGDLVSATEVYLLSWSDKDAIAMAMADQACLGLQVTDMAFAAFDLDDPKISKAIRNRAKKFPQPCLAIIKYEQTKLPTVSINL